MRNTSLEVLQGRIGYHFKDLYLLECALTHTSFANEQKVHRYKDYERLEFLGDAILEMVSSAFLYNEYPDKREGELTKIRASLVCEPSLADCARQIGIPEYLRLGKGEESMGGRTRDSIISDALEASNHRYDALFKGDFELAYQLLTSTNPFPEFTGRICPALCEKACVLNRFNHEPTTNREDECAIIEMAFQEGFILPRTDITRNGKKVAIIGAGPAGLAAANDLNHMGFTVTVFEKNEAAGGLLRYGIPNFKLNKAIIDRRLRLMEAEGITFNYGTAIDDDCHSEHTPDCHSERSRGTLPEI